MMDLAVIAIVLALAGTIFYTTRGRPAFVIRIRHGEPAVVKGDPPATFVTDVRRICELFDVQRGRIVGIRKGRHKIDLRFGGGLPESVHWQLRNAWNHPL
ncbi:MAG: DUF3634 family protein [Phycisphaeraceae bacterium]